MFMLTYLSSLFWRLVGGLMMTISERMTNFPMLTLARSPLRMSRWWRMAWSHISMLFELLMRHFFPMRFLDRVSQNYLSSQKTFFSNRSSPPLGLSSLTVIWLTERSVISLIYIAIVIPPFWPSLIRRMGLSQKVGEMVVMLGVVVLLAVVIMLVVIIDSKLMEGKLTEEEFRRNREEFTVQLRKQQREGIFKRRRGANSAMDPENLKVQNKIIVDQHRRQLIDNIMGLEFRTSQLEQFAQRLCHPDEAERHRAAIGLRVLVSAGQNFQLMQKVIDLGCVPVLLAAMQQRQLPQIQLEATWTLTNIACGRTSQCQSIIDKNGLEVFGQVIAQNSQHISEQAMWGLGNIAADCPKIRDTVLQKGCLEVVLKAISETKSVAMLQQGVWAVSVMCRGTPKPAYKLIKSAIPVLASLVKSGVLEEEEVASSLWAIGHHTEAQKTRIQVLVESKGFVADLIARCRKEVSTKVLSPLLRVVGNISAGNELQTEQLLRAGCLQAFVLLLDHPKPAVAREVCWIISNICVGTRSQLEQIVTCKELLSKLAVLFAAGDSSVKKEIAYILGNISVGLRADEVFEYVKTYRMLESLVQFVKSEDDGKCLEGGLFALFELLKVGEKAGAGGQNQVYLYLEAEPGFFDRLEALQSHPSAEVYKKVCQIFQGFFPIAEGSL